MNNKEIVIWAVDPFSSDLKLQRRAGSAIQALAGKRDLVVQPVYAAADPLPNLPSQFKEEVYRQLRERAQSEFDQLARGTRLNNLLPVAVIESASRSLNDRVSAMLDYAGKMSAGLIVASTRARGGAGRLLLGSFVEALTMRSPIPVFVVNPSWRRKPAFKELLFPTDFSDESKAAFEAVLKLASETRSRVHIFHKFLYEVAPSWNFSFLTAEVYADIQKQELKTARANAKKWEKLAKERGVRATSEIEDHFEGSVVDSILRRAKRGPFLIAMAAKSGPIEAAMLGSVTRQVLRHSSSPVWILNSERRDEALAEVEGNGSPERRHLSYVQ